MISVIVDFEGVIALRTRRIREYTSKSFARARKEQQVHVHDGRRTVVSPRTSLSTEAEHIFLLLIMIAIKNRKVHLFSLNRRNISPT